MKIKHWQFQGIQRALLGTSLLAIPGYLLLSISPAQAAVLGFETGDFTDWLTSGNTSIQNSSYGVTPPQGTYQALLETGAGSTEVFVPFAVSLESGNPPLATGFLFDSDQITAYGQSQSPAQSYTQGTAIKTQNPIVLAAGKKLTLTYDYNFLTNENPSSGNDDLAFLSLNQQIIPLTSVKTATLTTPSGTPFTAATGYQLNQTYSITSPGSYTLGFGVLDANDFATTSGVLLDNIRIEITDIPQSVPESTPSRCVWLGIALGLGIVKGKTRQNSI